MSFVRDTSLEAFLSIKGSLGAMQQVVYSAIANNPYLTDRELVNIIGLSDANMLRPRRKELLGKGFIDDAGVRECSVSGKKAHVWAITLGVDNV